MRMEEELVHSFCSVSRAVRSKFLNDVLIRVRTLHTETLTKIGDITYKTKEMALIKLQYKLRDSPRDHFL